MAIKINLKSGESYVAPTIKAYAPTTTTPTSVIPKTIIKSPVIKAPIIKPISKTPTTTKIFVPTTPVVKPKMNLLTEAFDQKEDYVKKFKKGDIAGGVANLAGATLTSAQSAYLNVANNLASLAQGKGTQPMKYQMSYSDYEKAVADRGGVKPTSEIIKTHSPLLGNIYNMALEVGTDPLELTPVGFLNDIKLAKGGLPTAASLQKAVVPTVVPKTTAQMPPQGSTIVSDGVLPKVEPTVSQFNANIAKPSKGVTNIEPTIKAQEKVTDKPIESFENKISYDPKNDKLPFSEWGEKARTQLTDRFASLERLEKQVTGKLNDASKSVYKQARLFMGVPEQASGRIEFNLKPIIKSVEDKGYTYKDLGNYAEAVHAKDVNAQGIDSGFTNQEIEAVINKYANDPIMESARQALLKYNDDLIQTLADSGRISNESLATMRTKYPNYMPLNRQLDDVNADFGFSLTEKFANTTAPIKALKGLGGKEMQTIDPIESMVANTYKLLTSAAQNDVGRQIKGLAEIDVDQNFIRQLKDTEKVGSKNVITVFEDGMKARYEVDPAVYKAMEGLNKENSNILMHILAKPTSVLRAGATLTPEFAVRNPMRDVVQAYITTGFNPLTDFVGGLASYLKKDDMYKSFLESKGAFGNLTSYDRTTNRKILKDIIKQPVTSKFITAIDPRTTVELLRKISDATESATKLGMYKKGIREGLSESESAYQARDLMDFARAGSTAKEMNKAIAFLNANIQGKSKIYRALKADPKGVTARMVKALVIPAITVKSLQYLMSNEEQQKTIQDSPDWMKDSFYLIPVPGTNQVARIPKPFDVAIVANTTERFMDYLLQNDPTAFEGLAKDTLKNQVVPIIPTAALPIIEAWSGKSSFRNAPIVPMREKELPLSMQYDVNTSQLSRTLAAGAEKVIPADTAFGSLGSPRVMENAIKGYTAGLGQYGMDIYDFISGAVKPVEAKRPEKLASQKPIARAFLVNEMSTGKPMDFVYSEFSKLNTKNNGEKLIGEEKEVFDDISKYKEALSGVSKEMRAIQNSKDFTPSEKSLLLKDLNDTRNDIAREAFDKYKRGETTEGFYSKYNLTEKQTEKLQTAETKGLTEKQVVDAYEVMKGKKTNWEKQLAIKTLPYTDEVKSRLFFTLAKE